MRLLLQGYSALVNLKFMFIASHMLVKWSLANSPLLSLRDFSGKPYTLIYTWNILLMMVSGFLDVIMVDAERRVAGLSYVAICVFFKILNLLQHIQGIMMPWVILLLVLVKDFLNIWQVLYSFVTFKISAFRFLLFLHSWPFLSLLVWSVCSMLDVQTVYEVSLLYLSDFLFVRGRMICWRVVFKSCSICLLLVMGMV